MTDVFLSYAHEDQPAASRLVDALARDGIDVWWDHAIPPGRTWDEVIGRRIDAAKVVIVVWSARSISSNFVKEEAQLAHDAGKFLPVRVEEVEPPIGFRRVHAANLVGWTGDTATAQWRALLAEIRERLGAPAPARANRPPPAPPPPPYQPPPTETPKNQTVFVVAAIAAVLAIAFALTQFNRAPETLVENTAQVETDTAAVEMQFWRSCCDRTDATAADYRSYLQRFPVGQFAGIASSRVEEAERPPPPPPAPPVSGLAFTGSRRHGSSDAPQSVEINHFIGRSLSVFAIYLNADHTVTQGGDRTYGRWSQSGSNVRFTITNELGVIVYEGVFQDHAIAGNYTWNWGQYTARGTFRFLECVAYPSPGCPR